MRFLDTIMAESELNELKESVIKLYKKYKAIDKKLLKEVAGNPDVRNISGDLDYVFDEAKRRFAAAQKAVSLANKLGDPEQKRRVFSNLNMLRAFVKQLTRLVNDHYDQIVDQAQHSTANRGRSIADADHFTFGK